MDAGLRILVLQHIACEPPGAYEDVLDARGARLVRVELDEGEPLPDWRAFDAIVAMGGPMGVYEADAHPWLVPELSAIGEAVRAGTPYFGACLGVKLLAAALGARVYRGEEPEVGLLPVELTAAAAADPVFAGFDPSVLTLQWHGDTFELPDGATLLASSRTYPHQAFRVGRAAYGIQFHLEVSAGLAAAWADVPAYATALERVLGPGALERLVGELADAADELRDTARTVFERWLDRVAFPVEPL